MIWDERPLGPVWTHIEALGRVFGRFCLWGICMRYDDYSDTDIELQWYSMGYKQLLRYSMGYRSVIEIQRYSATDMRYRSVIEIQRYSDTDMRYRQLIYRWDIGLWGPSEYTQRLWAVCLGAFVLWGLDYACTVMMRYEIVFPCLSVVAPGRDVTQIVRHCPSVEVRIWRDYFPGYLFDDSFGIQYLIW